MELRYTNGRVKGFIKVNELYCSSILIKKDYTLIKEGVVFLNCKTTSYIYMLYSYFKSIQFILS